MAKKDSVFWLIGLSLLLMLLDYSGKLFFFKNAVEVVILPTKQTVFRMNSAGQSLQEAIVNYPKLEEITKKNNKLEKEGKELALKVNLLSEENSKLRYQLAAPLPASYQFIPSQVAAVSRFMEIAAGESQGVKAGMPVVDGAIFIGKIVTVSAKRSFVMLPMDSDAAIPAKTSRGTKGIIAGQGGKAVMLDKVLQKDPLFLSDQVLTSGEGGYPANLLIGTIAHINADDVSAYKQAKVSPSLDYSKEQIVFVVSSL